MLRKIAIVGTQGIPNKYGGFETLVEFLADYLYEKYDITIFCSSKVYDNHPKEFKGCKLTYIPLYANGIQSIPYDIISLLKSVRKFDKIIVLGASGGLIFPFLKKYKSKFILNFGGLDWKRSKWNKIAQKVLKLSEKLAVKYSGHLIADNAGIQKYIKEIYARESKLIAYGGDQVSNIKIKKQDVKNYAFLSSPYCFSVARIQKDNNIEMILEAFSNNPPLPIVFVGNWNNSKYGLSIKDKFSTYKKIILLDAIYNKNELDLLRSNCSIYVHGHSAGGTNPSLVEAMNLGLPIITYSSGFNEFTTENKACYYSSCNELMNKIKTLNEVQLKHIGKEMKKIANKNYKWEYIVKKYSEILEK